MFVLLVVLCDHAGGGYKFHIVQIQFLNSIAGMDVVDDHLQVGIVLKLLKIKAVCKKFFFFFS